MHNDGIPHGMNDRVYHPIRSFVAFAISVKDWPSMNSAMHSNMNSAIHSKMQLVRSGDRLAFNLESTANFDSPGRIPHRGVVAYYSSRRERAYKDV